jgi:UPF0755 protein
MVEERDPQDQSADSLSARLASSIGRAAPKSPREALKPATIPPPPVRARAARRPPVIILNFALTAAVVICVLVGGAVLAARFEFQQPGASTDTVTLTVRQGAGSDEVADLIQRQGIGNRWVFVAGVRLAGAGAKLQAGEYLIPAHASLSDIMRQMVDGRVIVHSITFPEGLTSQQVVDCLMADTVLVNGYTSGLTAKQVDNCHADSVSLSGTIAQVPPEGALLPETYPYSLGDTRQSVIDRMRSDQAKLVADLWSRRAPDLPLKSSGELVTLASIIEKETSLSDERSRIASVYVNRLRLNMPLQADPTVIYALFKGAKPAGYTLSKSDLQVKSDYNTYAVGGLPPGPIANPGRASLEAAANPSRTHDLYFVADGSGGHVFAETYEDQQKNVAKYRVAVGTQVAAPSAVTVPGPVTPSAPVATPPAPPAAPQPQPRPSTPKP